jgi:hypothetical protein
MMALKGNKPGEIPESNRNGSQRETLKSAEAWKRMVKYWTIPYFGGGVGTLRVLKHQKV